MQHHVDTAFCRLFGCALLVGLAACGGKGLPEPGSEEYADAVAVFYAGVAGIETGAHQQAEQYLTRLTEIAPDEPAGWANRGLLALREHRLDAARDHLETARALAPDNGRIQLMLGMLAQQEGRTPDAVDHLRRAVDLSPGDLRAAYALFRVVGQDAPDESRQLLEQMLGIQPDNLAVLLEQARLGAQIGDADMLGDALTALSDRSGDWPEGTRSLFQDVRDAASAGDLQSVTSRIAFLENDLQRIVAYRDDLAAVEDPEGQEGTPFTRFVRLPQADSRAAAPDTTLRFPPTALAIDGGPWDWVGTLPLAGSRVLTLAVANGEQVKLGTGATMPFPGGGEAPGRRGVTAFDYDNDYNMDLALAGAAGFRIFRQEVANEFTDVTEATGLSAAVRDGRYTGVWTADLDQEGDLDVVLASPGSPTILRNNGDGTFDAWPLFEDGSAGLRDFLHVDMDADGDLDAVLLADEGRLHVYENLRAGRYEPAPPPPLGVVAAVAAADVDGDSRVELVALEVDGTVGQETGVAPEADEAVGEGDGASQGPRDRVDPEGWRVTQADAGDVMGEWEVARVATWTGAPDAHSDASLYVEDLDNNGALDVLAAAPAAGRIWLGDRDGILAPIASETGPGLFDVADLSGSGRLDLIGLSEAGQPVHHANEGAANYASKSIQVQAARTTGDRRINSFGIGGTVEIRAGLLYQKQRITSPTVRFGLGHQEIVHVARIVWPNGSMQAEFELETDQTVMAQQRLKGSCPWVFTHDGTEMRFVTDFLWRTALGLRINAQEGTNVMHGVDWVKIEADEMKPVDGFFDVRITAELWETHFFDEVALMVVDHAPGTEIHVDERFALPAPDWELHPTGPLQPIREARDDQGRDVTALVERLDGRYLDTFELGRYQGVAQEHYVELDLTGAEAPGGPLWLVASGWVRPTDSSINFAIAQGKQEPPRGISIDVPDGDGGWTTARQDVGFPAGKTKTILLDVDRLLGDDRPRRLRLRTNMEIYWDRLAWAPGRPDADVQVQRIAAERADLRYRGFSVVRQAAHSAPELPVYEKLSATTPQWRDLIGYHTRFGGVRDLIAATDDRYVIMNAGDELLLKFPAPPLQEGWTRDFVLIGDGWVKDGDYNTGHSKTVRPLPYHGLIDYTYSAERLADDPAYLRHPDDWRRYHTRYVTPDAYRRSLATP